MGSSILNSFNEKMKILFSFLILFGVISAENDCRAIIYELTGISCPNPMECSSRYVCNLAGLTNDFDEAEICRNYSCISAPLCPDGTIEVWPDEISQDGSEPHGTACKPPIEINEPEFPTMNCFFDPENNFKLTISAGFPVINRHPNIDDERKFAMISGEAWINHYDKDEWVQIFETSSCVGEEQDGIVKFEVQNSTECPFDSMKMVEEGGEWWYTVTAVFGFDDLLVGDAAAQRGKAYKATCKIAAMDTLWVMPGAEGDFGQEDLESETKIDFRMEMFEDDTFLIPFNGTIDIGDGSMDGRQVFVQVTADVSSENAILHLKGCEAIKQGWDGSKWVLIENQYVFISDGCLNNDIDEVNVLFEQKTKRVQWTDETTSTFTLDQFAYIPLQQKLEDGFEGVKVKLMCQAVGCQKDQFSSSSSGFELCQLNNNCANRYDNLLSTRRSLKGKNVSKVTEKSMEIIFRIDPDWVPPPSPTPPPSESASGRQQTSILALFAAASMLFSLNGLLC